MPTLPHGFSPVVAAYSHDGPGGVVRTEVAGGASRYGQDYERGMQKFNVTLIFAPEQFGVWVLFYTRIVKLGAVAFDMPLDSGLGTAAHSVHVVPGSYSTSRTGGTVTVVSFVVETQSAVYALSDAAVAAYGLSAASLPEGFVPTVAAYAIEGAGGAMRDEIAGGAAAYALDCERELQKYSCTLILAPARFAIWSVWFHRLIAKGARTFDMRLDSGFGVEAHACNILPGSYSAARTGGIHMAVSFVVEAENKAYAFSVAEAQQAIDLFNVSGGHSSALLARIAQFATIDTLVLP